MSSSNMNKPDVALRLSADVAHEQSMHRAEYERVSGVVSNLLIALGAANQRLGNATGELHSLSLAATIREESFDTLDDVRVAGAIDDGKRTVTVSELRYAMTEAGPWVSAKRTTTVVVDTRNRTYSAYSTDDVYDHDAAEPEQVDVDYRASRVDETPVRDANGAICRYELTQSGLQRLEYLQYFAELPDGLDSTPFVPDDEIVRKYGEHGTIRMMRDMRTADAVYDQFAARYTSQRGFLESALERQSHLSAEGAVTSPRSGRSLRRVLRLFGKR